MITSVAVQAYLSKIASLLKEQGFDPDMHIIYDSDDDKLEEWLSDALADTEMPRKGVTDKENVRKGPFTALFWTRSSLSPIVRQRYRLIDTPEGDTDSDPRAKMGKSTVSAKFRMACVFVSNKAEAVEDLEEAFGAVFQNTYNMPLSLEYIYNAATARPEDARINFTLIQNMGEADIVRFKEGNLFAYAWGADIFMNCVSEFAWSKVYPVEKVVVDLYGPGGVTVASLDNSGESQVHDHVADDGTVVKDVPDEAYVAFTADAPKDYIPFAISAPYVGAPAKITDEARAVISSAVREIGGEVSLRGTAYMMVALMALSPYHVEGASYDADILAAAAALSEAIHGDTGADYVITPMPPNE